MFDPVYVRQAKLLLRCLPEISVLQAISWTLARSVW
jgi:hypothetical protein